MNIAQIRRENKKANRQYQKFGEELFFKTLVSQAEIFDERLMTSAYVEYYQKVFPDAARRGYFQIRAMQKTKDFEMSDLFLNTWKAWIGVWVRENLGGLITNVNNGTRLEIRKILERAIELGLNPFQTQQLLTATIGSRARARAIAITEGTRANNMGLMRSGDDFELVTGLKMYKLWIHSGARREPRQSHISAQGKPIPKSQFFNIEGVKLDSPGNPARGEGGKDVARQVINCGCSMAIVTEDFVRERFPEALSERAAIALKPSTLLDTRELGNFSISGNVLAGQQYEEVIRNTMSELGLNEKLKFNFYNGRNGSNGSVGWVPSKDGGSKLGNDVNIYAFGSDIKGTIRHELRHIMQNRKMGLYIEDGFIHWENKPYISITKYNLINKGLRSKAYATVQKNFQKYINLPWEKDADIFGGVIRDYSKSFLDLPEFFLCDILEFPSE